MELSKGSMEDSNDIVRNDILTEGIDRSDDGMRGQEEEEEGGDNSSLGEGGHSEQSERLIAVVEERHRVRDEERDVMRDEQRDKARD